MSEPKALSPSLSVVVPFYDEEACAGRLLLEIRRVMEGLDQSYEVLAIDDGSTDRTSQILTAESAVDPRLRVLRWERNRGQAAALYHGLKNARGAIIITMDGDGQNDPEDIPNLLAHLDRADMVVGVRATRRDSWLRRVMSRGANRVRGWLLNDHMHDSGCALKVFRRPVVEALIPIRTLYSFMPALALAAGFRLAEVEVRHRRRRGGVSSYGLRQFLWRPLLDLAGVLWFINRRFTLPLT